MKRTAIATAVPRDAASCVSSAETPLLTLSRCDGFTPHHACDVVGGIGATSSQRADDRDCSPSAARKPKRQRGASR